MNDNSWVRWLLLGAAAQTGVIAMGWLIGLRVITYSSNAFSLGITACLCLGLLVEHSVRELAGKLRAKPTIAVFAAYPLPFLLAVTARFIGTWPFVLSAAIWGILMARIAYYCLRSTRRGP